VLPDVTPELTPPELPIAAAETDDEDSDAAVVALAEPLVPPLHPATAAVIARTRRVEG
jgi:hypothetical protein